MNKKITIVGDGAAVAGLAMLHSAMLMVAASGGVTHIEEDADGTITKWVIDSADFSAGHQMDADPVLDQHDATLVYHVTSI